MNSIVYADSGQHQIVCVHKVTDKRCDLVKSPTDSGVAEGQRAGV